MKDNNKPPQLLVVDNEGNPYGELQASQKQYFNNGPFVTIFQNEFKDAMKRLNLEERDLLQRLIHNSNQGHIDASQRQLALSLQVDRTRLRARLKKFVEYGYLKQMSVHHWMVSPWLATWHDPKGRAKQIEIWNKKK